jgi:hypothetical protein
MQHDWSQQGVIKEAAGCSLRHLLYFFSFCDMVYLLISKDRNNQLNAAAIKEA